MGQWPEVVVVVLAVEDWDVAVDLEGQLVSVLGKDYMQQEGLQEHHH